MTEFYTGQKKAFAFLENEIKHSGSKGVYYSLILYQTTLNYAISEKKVKERIKLMIDSKIIEEKGGLLFWNWLKNDTFPK